MRPSSQPTICLGQVPLMRTSTWTLCSRTRAHAGMPAAGKLRPAYFLSVNISPTAHVQCHTSGSCIVGPAPPVWEPSVYCHAACARLQKCSTCVACRGINRDLDKGGQQLSPEVRSHNRHADPSHNDLYGHEELWDNELIQLAPTLQVRSALPAERCLLSLQRAFP